jgi:mRNA interferase MazF
MKVRRADVVLVDYPYSDRTGSKIRPCLVIQNDRNNQRLDDTIVVVITSRTQFAANEPTQLIVDISTDDGRKTGLLFNSALQCENILTVDCQFIRRKIGEFSPTLLQHAAACIKISLDIT